MEIFEQRVYAQTYILKGPFYLLCLDYMGRQASTTWDRGGGSASLMWMSSDGDLSQSIACVCDHGFIYIRS